MNASFIHTLKGRARLINWQLLLFMLLVLNVKLPVKIAAVLIIAIMNRKTFSLKEFFRQPYLFFYFALTGIGLINVLLQVKTLNINYLAAAAIGLSFWMICAVIAYHIHSLIRQDDTIRIHNTITAFFVLHITAVFLNLLGIIFETGALNPYTYKGLNQKYYISTGDFIMGITFDAPVTTAFICVFGLIYFLYRRRFLLSIGCMAALLIMASNFANLVLVGTLGFIFIFNSTRIQKSLIIIYFTMLIIFMAKISPQNTEHVGRIFYQIIDKPYDLPPVKVLSLDELKKMPDSALDFEQRRKKYAQNYIDSMSAIRLGPGFKAAENILVKNIPVDSNAIARSRSFYVFHESPVVEEKINSYAHFLSQMYSTEKQDSLKKSYNWKLPGKWIAGKQVFNFFKRHPYKLLLGDGIGNFSSRIAFKATLLNIAGRYPERLKYVNGDFLDNHLYLYLYYHSQDQSKHEATNTPDAVYYQVAGEYGLAGILCLAFLYFGFYTRHLRKKSYGIPLIIILAGAFFAEYWFEQFSIVVLFELLLFTDIKEMRREEQPS